MATTATGIDDRQARKAVAEISKEGVARLLRDADELRAAIKKYGSGLDEEIVAVSGTLLYAAVEMNMYPSCKLLVESVRLNLDASNSFTGVTPLLSAAMHGFTNIAVLLIDHGADVNTYVNEHESALFCAVQTANFDLMKTLFEHKAKLIVSAEDSNAVFGEAIAQQNIRLIRDLLKYKAQVNVLTYVRGISTWPLIYVVDCGIIGIVELLLDYGANMLYVSESGDYALVVAVARGYFDIAKLLLARGAAKLPENVLAKSLCAAVENKNLAMADLLLKHGISPAVAFADRGTPMDIAYGNSDTPMELLLLKAGANPFVPSEGGDLFFSYWIHDRTEVLYVEALKQVRARKWNVNVKQEKTSNTALMCAVQAKDLAIVKKLLEAGADPLLKSGPYGVTHIASATARDFTDGMAALVAAGADVNAHSDRGSSSDSGSGSGSEVVLTPLMVVSSVAACKILLDAGADVNLVNEISGESPLHYASRNNKPAIAKMLLSRGADANSIDFTGNTPLFMAVNHTDTEIVSVLLKHGVDINYVNPRNGLTALGIACVNSSANMCEFLLNNGAGVDGGVPRLITPLIAACCRHKPSLVAVILARSPDVGQAICGDNSRLFKKFDNNVICARAEKVTSSDSPNGITAIVVAAFFGDSEIIELIIKASRHNISLDISPRWALVLKDKLRSSGFDRLLARDTRHDPKTPAVISPAPPVCASAPSGPHDAALGLDTVDTRQPGSSSDFGHWAAEHVRPDPSSSASRLIKEPVLVSTLSPAQTPKLGGGSPAPPAAQPQPNPRRPRPAGVSPTSPLATSGLPSVASSSSSSTATTGDTDKTADIKDEPDQSRKPTALPAGYLPSAAGPLGHSQRAAAELDPSGAAGSGAPAASSEPRPGDDDMEQKMPQFLRRVDARGRVIDMFGMLPGEVGRGVREAIASRRGEILHRPSAAATASRCGLTADEVDVLFAFTLENQRIYDKLNAAVRLYYADPRRNMDALEPWLVICHRMWTALHKLPVYTKVQPKRSDVAPPAHLGATAVVFRGIGLDLEMLNHDYAAFTVIKWSSFTSTSVSIKKACEFALRSADNLGQPGEIDNQLAIKRKHHAFSAAARVKIVPVVFNITSNNGRNIAPFSDSIAEVEILLPMDSHFVVSDAPRLVKEVRDIPVEYYLVTLIPARFTRY